MSPDVQRYLQHPWAKAKRILAFLLVLVGLSASPAMAAPEFFGEFRDPLEGRFVDAQPRPMFKLAAQFRFVDPNGLLWIVPPGKEVDGASIPQAFWSFIGGPFEGAYIKASVTLGPHRLQGGRREQGTSIGLGPGIRRQGHARPAVALQALPGRVSRGEEPGQFAAGALQWQLVGQWRSDRRDGLGRQPEP